MPNSMPCSSLARRRRNQPKDDADGCEHQPLSNHQPEHLLLLRSKSHPNPDFLRPLNHGIRQNTINPNYRQNAGDAGKDTQQDRIEPLTRHGTRHKTFDGNHRIHPGVGINGADACARTEGMLSGSFRVRTANDNSPSARLVLLWHRLVQPLHDIQ